jgi:hypothetical protein
LTARSRAPKNLLTWVLRIGVAYPWGWLATVYAVWLIAYASLGRRPRPLLDYPKHLSGVVEFLHTASVYCFLFALPALFAGLTAAVSLRVVKRAPWRTALAWLGAVLLSWTAAVAYIRLDPGRVVAWYID